MSKEFIRQPLHVQSTPNNNDDNTTSSSSPPFPNDRRYVNAGHRGADPFASIRRNPLKFEQNNNTPSRAWSYATPRQYINNEPNYLITDNSDRNYASAAPYRAYRYGARSIARSSETANAIAATNKKSSRTKNHEAIKDMSPRGLLATATSKLKQLHLEIKTKHDYQRIFLITILFGIIAISIPSYLEILTRPEDWKWTPNRNLGERTCVMNLFIEKQPPDEFNPDFKDPKKDPKNKNKRNKHKLKPPPPEIAPGTYRTKGQLHVISRFIEAVATSFRSNTDLHQHLIFSGTRDGGHLAEQAMRHWPPRGTHRTQVHVIAADSEEGEEDDPLKYDLLNGIEERFRGNKEAHIYDRNGMAGYTADDDEEELDSADLPRYRQMMSQNGTASGLSYLDIPSLIPDDDNIVIPYMHVDGVDQASQMEVLESARSLLEMNKLVSVGIEHSEDLDVYNLLDFFDQVNYKLFFLGSRQISRIDNLCEEILEDIIRHPSITPSKPTKIGSILQTLGIIEHGLDDDKEDQKKKYPPFFVAMPKGRINKEEMTIQHMYDLFGGYGGGGGQIKTANDRKAPGKK